MFEVFKNLKVSRVLFSCAPTFTFYIVLVLHFTFKASCGELLRHCQYFLSSIFYHQFSIFFYSLINFFTPIPFSVLTSTIYTPHGNAETSTFVLLPLVAVVFISCPWMVEIVIIPSLEVSILM